MSRRRSLLFNRAVASTNINTFIGGMGGTLSTATLLASKLSISDTDISNFIVDSDNNITCLIETNYSINVDGFVSSALTYYIDIDGYCTELGLDSLRNCTGLKAVIFPSVTTAGANVLLNASSNFIEVFSAPILNPVGTTSGSNNFFINTYWEYLYTDVVNETNNGGSPDADISYVIPRTDNFRYSDNTTSPSSVTDLTIDGNGGSYIDLSWSAPTSSNSLDIYLVFINNVYVGYSDTESYQATGLSLSTTYSLNVVAIDIEGNNSGFSNTVSTTTSASYQVPTGNIVSYWDFNTNSNDQVGSNNGTDTSVSYVSTGGIGNSADFTAGTTSKIEVADSDTLSFGNGTTDSPFSIVFLIKFDTVATVVPITKSGAAGSVREYVAFTTATLLRLDLYDGTSANYIRKESSWSPVVSTWYHITMTYNGNGDASGITIYADGVAISGTNSSVGTYVAMENTATPLTIGKFSTAFGQLDGYMDETAIFDKELTAGEVDDIYSKYQAGEYLTE